MKKVIITIVLILIVIVGGSKLKNNEVINTNTLVPNIADPFILSDNGTYYLYGTTGGNRFDVYSSTDLSSWKLLGTAYKPEETSWETGDLWAPEVYKYNGKYYMFYSARQEDTEHLQLGVVESDSPVGPFVNTIGGPLTNYDYSVIDASLLVTEEANYLYYSKDCSENIVDGKHTSQIYVSVINDTLTELVGEPILLTTPDQAHDLTTGDYVWNEAPYVIEVDEIYYLFYSSGFYGDEKYNVSYATSDTPIGPFTKSESNPLIESNLEEGFSGPGHPMIFESEDKYYIAYHVHMSEISQGGERGLVINEIKFKNGEVTVLDPIIMEE